jgi:hypothetical protein
LRKKIVEGHKLSEYHTAFHSTLLTKMKRKDSSDLYEDSEWSLTRKRAWDLCPPISSMIPDVRNPGTSGNTSWKKYADSYHVQSWIKFLPCKSPIVENEKSCIENLENRYVSNCNTLSICVSFSAFSVFRFRTVTLFPSAFKSSFHPLSKALSICLLHRFYSADSTP